MRCVSREVPQGITLLQAHRSFSNSPIAALWQNGVDLR